MTTFSDREKAFEDKFKHDEELRFRVEVRRNRMIGRWAAELMGKSGSDADDYAKEVVDADFEEAGSADVVRKLIGDLTAAGVDMSEHRILRKLDELEVLAKQQIMNE